MNVFPGNYEDYLWRKEGKEIDLTLPGLPDLVGERALARQRGGTGLLPKAQATPSALQIETAQSDSLAADEGSLPRDRRAGGAPRGRDRRLCDRNLTHFRSAEDSVRLTKLIEQGREEVARLMREWEDTAKVVEEQEAEVRE